MFANVLNENHSIINSEDNGAKSILETDHTQKTSHNNFHKASNILLSTKSSIQVIPYQLSKTIRLPSAIGNALSLKMKNSDGCNIAESFVKKNSLTWKKESMEKKQAEKLESSASNAPSEAEKAVNELTRIKEEIKLKNNNFIDELFEKSMESIEKIYKEHTSSLNHMSFDNTMSDRLEEFYLNKSSVSTMDRDNGELKNSPGRKRRRLHRNMDRPFTLKELNKLNRLKELIGASRLAENIELSAKSNKSTTQMDTVESDGLKKLDQNGPQPSTQSECNSGNSIEEDLTKHDFIEENSDQTVIHKTNNSIDTTNIEMETSDSPYPFPMKSISNQKELIPIKAILSLVIFYRGNKPGITLTWDVKKSNDTLSKLSRYEECKDASFRSLIKEYEIYGYKETKDKSNYKYKTPWQMIGTVENFLPPVKCTLTDFQKGQTYFFSVRIIDIYGCYSDFSDPTTAKL